MFRSGREAIMDQLVAISFRCCRFKRGDPFHQQSGAGGIGVAGAGGGHLVRAAQGDAGNHNAPRGVARGDDTGTGQAEIAVLGKLIEGMHGVIRQEPVQVHR